MYLPNRIRKTNFYPKNGLRKEQGQSVMEYVILTSLIGIFCLVVIKQFGQRLKTRIQQMNSKIEKHINIY